MVLRRTKPLPRHVRRLSRKNACRKRRQLLKSQRQEASERLDVTPINEGTYENAQTCEDDDDLVIEKISKSSLDCDVREHEIENDRMINISFFLKEQRRTYSEHKRGIECPFEAWRLVNSRRYGFRTQFFFECVMCKDKANCWSPPDDGKSYDINKAVTAGTILAGVGYAQMEEIFAAANIPCMSEKTYIENREKIIDDFERVAFEEMKKASEEEKQLVIENNETINGIPYITVVADGSWMKRSYGTAYDSFSGVGAIIGYRTKKILFIGIRNKYCTVCNTAQRTGMQVKSHKCYKNYDRNASSTKMESDAIIEGSKCSIEMHGLIFKTIIADGDSNVYQFIRDNKPYREQVVEVKKIECTNHLLRNLCKKLKLVAQTTEPKVHRNRSFIQCRNIVKNNILKIRKQVLEAAAIRRQEKEHYFRVSVLILNCVTKIRSV